MKGRFRWVLKAILIAAFLGMAASGRADDVFPGERWEEVSSPEVLGWSSEMLRIADDFARKIQTDAYLVVQKGVIVHEYGDTTRATNIHSMRKSILSVLMGIYRDRGAVDLDKTLADLGMDDKQGLSPVERQATVRQLLQARSGVYHPAAYETAKMSAARPARGSCKPGEHWYYNNWDFNALGTIFQKFTGKTVFESLCEDLAEPLQFENFRCNLDTRFQFEGASVHPAYIMRLSARDLARLGLLMARNGIWKGRRIVSEQWITDSTTSYSETDRPGRGYGYLWWVNLRQGTFSANGHKGQHVLVNPASDLVIVHKVDSEHDSHRVVTGRQLTKLLNCILNAKSP